MSFLKIYKNKNLREDDIWRQDIAPYFEDIPRIVYDKVHYIFTEMMNNAIEHSDAEEIKVYLWKSPVDISFAIEDNGIGIFRKIQESLCLPEKSFAILELSKGKLTTAPENHTGEGIFFSSRIADIFAIISDELVFASNPQDKGGDTLFKRGSLFADGTSVFARINFDTSTTISDVFHMFTEHPEHIGFNATHVPVRLLEYGAESPVFVSRSEGRRLLARFERFGHITLDFSGVEAIRQGFADEVFRVFPNAHPGCKIEAVHCNEEVQAMIEHVKNTK